MLKQSKMLSSRGSKVLVGAAENEMMQLHTHIGLQVQPHKDHKYRDLFPSLFPIHVGISTFKLFVHYVELIYYIAPRWLISLHQSNISPLPENVQM